MLELSNIIISPALRKIFFLLFWLSIKVSGHFSTTSCSIWKKEEEGGRLNSFLLKSFASSQGQWEDSSGKKAFLSYFAQTERHFAYQWTATALSKAYPNGFGTLVYHGFVTLFKKKRILDFLGVFFKSVLAEKLGKVCLPNASAPPKRLAFVREYERALTCKMTPMVFSFLGATNRDSHAPVKYRIPKMEASLDNFCLLHFSANGRTCSRTSS